MNHLSLSLLSEWQVQLRGCGGGGENLVKHNLKAYDIHATTYKNLINTYNNLIKNTPKPIRTYKTYQTQFFFLENQVLNISTTMASALDEIRAASFLQLPF